MGFIVGIINGITVAFQNNQFKKLKGIHPYVINWLRFVFGTIVMVVIVSVFTTWKVPAYQFWLLLIFVSLPLELVNSFYYVKAFQHSPQSLVGPLFSLSLIFLVPITYFLLGELPTPIGFVGIIFVLIGTMALGWNFSDPGLRPALRKLYKEKGARYMILSAFLSACTVSAAKYTYEYTSSPLIFSFYMSAVLAIAFTIPALRQKASMQKTKVESGELIFMNVAYGIGQALHYIGLSLLPAAYYISVKRSSILFDVLMGKMIHKEKNILPRLIGVGLMLIGLVFIAFATVAK